jgi:hypothetical protein
MRRSQEPSTAWLAVAASQSPNPSRSHSLRVPSRRTAGGERPWQSQEAKSPLSRSPATRFPRTKLLPVGSRLTAADKATRNPPDAPKQPRLEFRPPPTSTKDAIPAVRARLRHDGCRCSLWCARQPQGASAVEAVERAGREWTFDSHGQPYPRQQRQPYVFA